MPTPTAASFDPNAFLEKVDARKGILSIPKGQHVPPKAMPPTPCSIYQGQSC
jgi:hypothetical protein